MRNEIFTKSGDYSAFALRLGIVQKKSNIHSMAFKELFMTCGTYFVGYSFGDRVNDYKKEGFSTLKEAKKFFNSIKI